MASRITKEWRLPVGRAADGTPEFRVIGHEIEDDFGGGNKTTRLRLNLDVLNPVLYQMAKSQAVAGSTYGYAVRAEFAKRYKDPSAPEVAGVLGGEDGDGDGGIPPEGGATNSAPVEDDGGRD